MAGCASRWPSSTRKRVDHDNASAYGPDNTQPAFSDYHVPVASFATHHVDTGPRSLVALTGEHIERRGPDVGHHAKIESHLERKLTLYQQP
jgi:hypothetical protein